MNQDQYVQALKAFAEDQVKKAVMKRLIAAAPIFATGLANYIAVRIVTWVLVNAFDTAELGAFFWYIDMRVDRQGSEFSEAAHKWYFASPEDKAKYEKEYLEKFYALASFKS